MKRMHLRALMAFSVLAYIIFIFLIIITRQYAQNNFFIKENSQMLIKSAELNSITQEQKCMRRILTHQLNDSSIEILIDTLQDVQNALKEEEFTYFLDFGSLIGSVRHHGPVPWIDNVDIMVPLSQQLITERAFFQNTKYVLKKYTKYKDTWSVFKYNPTCSRLRTCTNQNPFVSIIFYEENITYIFHRDLNTSQNAIPKTLLFPLAKRPFGKLLVPVPRMSRLLLKTLFEKYQDTCVYSSPHENSDSKVNCNINCTALYNYFPFVFSYPLRSFEIAGEPVENLHKELQVEELRIGRRTVKRALVNGL